MDEGKRFRNELAIRIKAAPKGLRRAMLRQAQETTEYVDAFLDHYQSFWNEREINKKREVEARQPNIKFTLEDESAFNEQVCEMAAYIYSTMKDYDPHRGDMSCAVITDELRKIFEQQGIFSRKIERIYEILDPNGSYNDSFGHVYCIIEKGEQQILVDPTYLQFVEKEERKELQPVLVIYFKDKDDLKTKLKSTPIKNGLYLPFYLGFDSEEARYFFRNSKYTVLSNDRAKIDD